MYLGLLLIPCASLLSAILNGLILHESKEDGEKVIEMIKKNHLLFSKKQKKKNQELNF